MRFPCEEHVACPGSDEPILNLSSEVADLLEYLGTGYFNKVPPMGTTWYATACQRWFNSEVSQADADQQAALAAQLCVGDNWVPPWNPSVIPPRPPQHPPEPPRPPEPPDRFYNRATSCQEACPDGAIFTFHVRAGMFSATTQAAADDAAKQYCKLTLPVRKICLSNIINKTCVDKDYSDQIIASGQSLAVPPDVNKWQITKNSSSSWVVGTVDPTDSSLFNITGKPPHTGVASFIVKCTEPTGDSITKNYTIKVWGITNTSPLATGIIGTAYIQTLTAAQGSGYYTFALAPGSGALPDGLTLDTAGNISGTPTTIGQYDFTVRVTDIGPYGSGTAYCDKDLQITITGTPPPAAFVYWKLDELAGDRIDSEWGVHLVPSGAVSADTGLISNAVHFGPASPLPHSDQLITPLEPVLDYGGTDITFTAWFKFVAAPTQADIMVIAEYSTGNFKMDALYDFGGSQVVLNGLDGINSDSVTVPLVPVPGKWYMVTAVYNNTTKHISLSLDNGTPVVGVIVFTPASTGNGSAAIGRVALADNGNNDWLVDEFGIWQQLLTTDQLAYLYNGGSGNRPPGLS